MSKIYTVEDAISAGACENGVREWTEEHGFVVMEIKELAKLLSDDDIELVSRKGGGRGYGGEGPVMTGHGDLYGCQILHVYPGGLVGNGIGDGGDFGCGRGTGYVGEVTIADVRGDGLGYGGGRGPATPCFEGEWEETYQ